MKKIFTVILLIVISFIVGCKTPEPTKEMFDLDIEISEISMYKDANYLFKSDYEALVFDKEEDINDIKEDLSTIKFYKAKLSGIDKKEIYDYIIKLRDDYVIYIIDNEEFIMYHKGEYKEGIVCEGTLSVFNIYLFGDKLETVDKGLKFDDITYMSITFNNIKVNVTSNNYIKNLFVESLFYKNSKGLVKDTLLYEVCVNDTIYSIYNNGLVLENNTNSEGSKEYYVNVKLLEPFSMLLEGEELIFSFNDVTKIVVTNQEGKTKEIKDKEDFLNKFTNIKYYQVKNEKDFIIGNVIYKIDIDGLIIGVYNKNIIIIGDKICIVTEGSFGFLNDIKFSSGSGWLPWV